MHEPNILQMIHQLEDERRVTKWEMGFIESVSEQFEEKGHLSPKQISSLKEIYDKYNN